MPADKSRLELIGTIDERTLRPVVRAGVVLVAAVAFLALLAVVPGLDRLLPLAPIDLATLVGALIALVIAAVLVSVASRIERMAEDALSGPDEVVSGAAAIARNLVLFLAVLVAYRGLASAVAPFLTPFEAGWLYDGVFLLFALGPLAMIGYHLYHHVDPVTDLLTRELLTAVGTDSNGPEAPNGETE